MQYRCHWAELETIISTILLPGMSNPLITNFEESAESAMNLLLSYCKSWSQTEKDDRELLRLWVNLFNRFLQPLCAITGLMGPGSNGPQIRALTLDAFAEIPSQVMEQLPVLYLMFSRDLVLNSLLYLTSNRPASPA